MGVWGLKFLWQHVAIFSLSGTRCYESMNLEWHRLLSSIWKTWEVMNILLRFAVLIVSLLPHCMLQILQVHRKVMSPVSLALVSQLNTPASSDHRVAPTGFSSSVLPWTKPRFLTVLYFLSWSSAPDRKAASLPLSVDIQSYLCCSPSNSPW